MDDINYEDIDIVLVQMIKVEDQVQPLTQSGAVAVRAIIALSQAGQPAKARELMAELIQVRANIRRSAI